MNRVEHLLICLAEECAEVAHRASKALRFGLTEIQDGQGYTNERRLLLECADFLAVWELLRNEGVLRNDGTVVDSAIRAKKGKVEEFLRYSEQCGTLK